MEDEGPKVHHESHIVDETKDEEDHWKTMRRPSTSRRMSCIELEKPVLNERVSSRRWGMLSLGIRFGESAEGDHWEKLWLHFLFGKEQDQVLRLQRKVNDEAHPETE